MKSLLTELFQRYINISLYFTWLLNTKTAEVVETLSQWRQEHRIYLVNIISTDAQGMQESRKVNIQQ